METPAISNMIAPQGANAALAAGSDAGVAAEPADGLFGVLLARQIALALPLGDAPAPAVDAEPAGADVDAAAVAAGPAQQGDPLLLGLLPQGAQVQLPAGEMPSVNQRGKQNDTRDTGVDNPVVVAGFVPVVGTSPTLTGKNLPTGTAGQPEVAAVGNAQPNVAEAANIQPKPDLLPAIPSAAGEPEFKAAFEALLGDKKVIPAMPDGAGTQAAPVSVPQMQAAPASPGGVHAVKQPDMTVPQHVGSESWGAGLGDKVVWMVGNQTRGAEIHLNPPALGPLEVRVSVSDGQANLSFMTHHASVREAIEAATPRLREMLNDAGVGMGSVSVNVGSFSQQQMPARDPEYADAAWRSRGDEPFAVADAPVVVARPLHGRGMVDLFA